MPTHKDFYDAVSNTSINADTINLNVDAVETKLDTATGLLTTLSADTALIKTDMANGVLVNGTVTANTGITQPLTNAELRATVVPTEVYTGGSAVGSSNALTIKTANAYGSNQPTVVIGYNQTGSGVTQPSDTNGFPIRPSSSAIFKASVAQATTPAVTTFTSITSATLIASNTSRSMLTIQNTGAGILYVLFGTGVASATNFSLQMNSGDFYECDYYSGQMNAIFASSGTAYVTSLT